jgi:hypothetical protein
VDTEVKENFLHTVKDWKQIYTTRRRERVEKFPV